MQIKSVAVLGAGAVGSYIIWGLSSRKDIRLAVIAEGPRAERLKQQGITTADNNHDGVAEAIEKFILD